MDEQILGFLKKFEETQSKKLKDFNRDIDKDYEIKKLREKIRIYSKTLKYNT